MDGERGGDRPTNRGLIYSASMSTELVIEPVRDFRGYRACERLQREVWGFPDISIIPDHALHMIVQAGGLLLGAFDGVGPGREMVGFSLSVLGLWEGQKLRHFSLMTAVKPGLQNQGIGEKLKLAQREHVLRQGIDLITWTFDPLESRNAHFNLNKLGGIVRNYYPSFFGEEMRDALNQGLPSDRFLCEWYLSSPRVNARLESRRPPELRLSEVEVINRTQRLPSGQRAPAGGRLGLSSPFLFFEIPTDLRALKRENLEAAQAWRKECRKFLAPYLEEGYLVTGLVRQGDRSFLVLERASLEEVVERP
jgi:predicted GNAT superfamily acetyltransferase